MVEYWHELTNKASTFVQQESTLSSILLKSISTLVLATTIPAIGYHLMLSYRRKGEAPVRWSWLPVIGSAIEMGQRPVELLQDCAAQYGEIFGIVIGGNRMFFVSDVFSTSSILKAPKELSFQEFTDSIMQNVFGCTKHTVEHRFTKAFDQDMRKIYSQYLLT